MVSTVIQCAGRSSGTELIKHTLGDYGTFLRAGASCELPYGPVRCVIMKAGSLSEVVTRSRREAQPKCRCKDVYGDISLGG